MDMHAVHSILLDYLPTRVDGDTGRTTSILFHPHSPRYDVNMGCYSDLLPFGWQAGLTDLLLGY